MSWEQVFVLTAANPETNGCIPKVNITLSSANHETLPKLKPFGLCTPFIFPSIPNAVSLLS